MRILLLVLAVLCMASSDSFAQKKKKPGKKEKVHEFGPSLGVSAFFGDLGGADRRSRGFFFDFDVDATRPAAGLIYRFNFSKRMALRASAFMAYVSGDDKFTDYEPRRNRNLHFRSHLLEGAVVFELNLARFEVGSENRFAPYLFGGIGLFNFNPQAYDSTNDAWVDLQPLGTEGQNLLRYPDRQPYDLTQLCVPYGFGFKFGVTPNWALGFEFAPRITFTDYIDDVSKTYVRHTQAEVREFADRSADDISYSEGAQRGDPSNNDAYFFGGLLSLTYKIKSKNDQYKCPKVFK